MIKINRFFISAEPYNILLQEESVREKGKYEGEEYLKVLGYYNNLENTVIDIYRILVKERLATPELEDVKVVIKDLKKIKHDLIQEMKQVSIEDISGE